jgi:hypothetical protein
LPREAKHADSADDAKTLSKGTTAAAALVHQKDVGISLAHQHDGFPLA